MTASTLNHPSGRPLEVEAFSATDAKKSFGAILDAAIAHGIVAITRQSRTRAVMLSLEEYEALLRRLPDPQLAAELVVCWHAVKCRPPLPAEELRRTLDSIAAREMRRRGFAA